MPSTTSHKFGDVVFVPFPFSDQSGTKKRPAVVVSSAKYNQAGADVILMAVTSQQRQGTRLGSVSIPEWQTIGLRYPSVIVAKLTTLEKSKIRQHIGCLERKTKQTLRQALATVLG